MPAAAGTPYGADVSTAVVAPPMLLDRLAPRPDAARIEHLVVDAAPPEAFAAVLAADFMEAARESRAVRSLFALRSAGEHALAAVRHRPLVEPEYATLRLADLTDHGEWVVLGTDPPSEIAFGTIGRFWSGETTWEVIDARDFASFDRPGFGRIACGFSVRPYGERRSLVSYECRTTTTDAASRTAFLRYWRPLAPFIGVVLRAQLRVVARDAARR